MKKNDNPITERVEKIGVDAEREREEDAIRRYNEREKKYGDRRGGEKTERTKTVFVAVIVALSILSLTLGTLLIIEKSGSDGSDEERYVKAEFYNFNDYVGDVDENLSKLIVSADRSSQQRYLGEITTKSLLAAESVAALPIRDESKFNTISFANKVSDYAKYLNNQLIDGLSITEQDFDNLKEIHRAATALKNDIADLNANMNGDFDLKSLKSGDASNMVLKTFDELETRSENYPKLIYDGPFSDALEQKTPKGLPETEITLAQAKEVFAATFGIDAANVEETGETVGVIETFDFKAKISDAVEIYANVSKRGGKLISFNYFADCSENEYDLERCGEIGESFLSKIGLSDMKAVWATESGATAYINFAYETNGVIVYNDMIKMTVCKERGIVSNFDAREYYLNHVERDIPAPEISEDDAREKLSVSLNVESARLAYIPYGESREILAYEFEGKYDGSTYFVYIDALSGKQAQVFKVVETTEGTLLI